MHVAYEDDVDGASEMIRKMERFCDLNKGSMGSVIKINILR